MYSPRKSAFLDLATKGNVIPVTRTILADFETPLSAYWKIRGETESFLFESVEGGEHIGRYSFVGWNPRAVIRQNGNRVVVSEGGRELQHFTVSPAEGGVKDGLAVVEKIMAGYRSVALPELPRFTGGAVGFIGYEFIHDVEPVVPKPGNDELRTPTLYFVIADSLLIFDRVKQTITLLVNAMLSSPADAESAYEAAIHKLDNMVETLRRPAQLEPVSVPAEIPEVPVTSNVSKEQFLANVQKAKKYILSGDIIQVVGSQRFSAKVTATPFDVYRAARSINPSPYMFLLELKGFSLVGASPEIHVRCEDRQVEIRPIAGTRPRGKTLEEDRRHETDLLADPKERAEHVMLVDLARNDLGRVCDYGSVEVKELMIIERYSHVMHIVSQVEGVLSPDRNAYDLMRATFPAGTLSGAPKIRAMQIIAELEQTQRGPYGGCVGYFAFNGNLDCCITIRTALIQDGTAYIQAGGGWVNDSDPEAEYQETVNKSKAMLKAVAMAEYFRQQSKDQEKKASAS
jgi:anthranilate synthase component 1